MAFDPRTVTRASYRAPAKKKRGWFGLGDAEGDAWANANGVSVVNGQWVDANGGTYSDFLAIQSANDEFASEGWGAAGDKAAAAAKTAPAAAPSAAPGIFAGLANTLLAGGAQVGAAALQAGRQSPPLSLGPRAPAPSGFSLSSLLLPVGVGLGGYALLKAFKVL